MNQETGAGGDRSQQVDSGGQPETIGRCTECWEVYPVQETADGALRPVGTGGSCKCGCSDFEPLPQE